MQLEADLEARDRYGRRLSYVIVDGDRFTAERAGRDHKHSEAAKRHRRCCGHGA